MVSRKGWERTLLIAGGEVKEIDWNMKLLDP
jgi:hypothetical protein